jgi:hypothetical protein
MSLLKKRHILVESNTIRRDGHDPVLPPLQLPSKTRGSMKDHETRDSFENSEPLNIVEVKKIVLKGNHRFRDISGSMDYKTQGLLKDESGSVVFKKSAIKPLLNTRLSSEFQPSRNDSNTCRNYGIFIISKFRWGQDQTG